MGRSKNKTAEAAKLPLTEQQESDLRDFVDMCCDYAGTEKPCEARITSGVNQIIVEFLPKTPADVARMIGKKGQHITSVRTLLQRWSVGWKTRITVEVIDGGRRR